MNRKKIRNYTGGLSPIQSKIILLRGLIPESELLYQKDFAQKLRRPLSTINYNIGVLKKKNMIGTSNFLTPDGKVVFQKLNDCLNNTKLLRAHKIFGTFILTSPYKDFEKVKDKYTRISKSPKHKGFRIDFKDCIVLFYSSMKICFYLPSVYANSFAEIYVETYERYIKPLKEYLEQEFEGICIDQYQSAEVVLNHVAYMHHPLAQIFNHFKSRYVSDRIEVDHSHGIPELETVHRDYSVQDMDRILEYEELIRLQRSVSKNNEGVHINE